MLLLATLTGCVPVLTSPPNTNEGSGVWEAPANEWPLSEPPASLEGEGMAMGQVAPDFLLQDQNGDNVSLWQFYGRLIVLDVSTMWCRPCQQLAEEAQAIADDYRDDIVYITLLPEDLEGDIPDQDELNQWGDTFDLHEPIIADETGYSYLIVPDQAFPGVLLIDRNMVVTERIEPASDATIRAAIEDAR